MVMPVENIFIPAGGLAGLLGGGSLINLTKTCPRAFPIANVGTVVAAATPIIIGIQAANFQQQVLLNRAETMLQNLLGQGLITQLEAQQILGGVISSVGNDAGSPIGKFPALSRYLERELDKVRRNNKRGNMLKCIALHDAYKRAQRQFAKNPCSKIARQQPLDCDAMQGAMTAKAKEIGLRTAYVNFGCDKFDWTGKGNQPTQRSAAHLRARNQAISTLKNCGSSYVKGGCCCE